MNNKTAEKKVLNTRLSREDGTNKVYNNLLSRSGPLNSDKKKYTRDIFRLALAYGYINDIRMPIETKDNFVNKTNFGKTLPAMINVLAITKSSKGIEILAEDPVDVYQTAEEYANGGLDFLNSEYTQNADEFIEMLRLKILEFNKDDKILKKLDELDI